MTNNARIPKFDRTDPRLLEARRLLAEVADERCGEACTDFMTRSRAARGVTADLLWLDEQERMEAERTTAPEIEVDGERYRRLKQASSVLVHSLWGAHLVVEPLYRLVGVHNGPTIKPLVAKLGLVDGSLLPDLADEAGELLSKMTSRDVESTLLRQGFRPPSRTTLANRLGGMLAEISTGAREFEDACRAEESLDFELGAISCGLDRFAARMDETLADGPERSEKLRRRRPLHEYQRKPPEPRTSNWRMAWAANVTLYDTVGRARHSLRYGADAGHDVELLVARVVDDVHHLCERHAGVPVACIQDGGADLQPLRRRLRERLPKTTEVFELTDFHHAIGYLDAIIAARNDGDPADMASWYRLKLLNDTAGAQHIVDHLRRLTDGDDARSDALDNAVNGALGYFSKRRPLMRYAAARENHLPVGSGATESTCALFQLRVKHPGSHWRPVGLRSIMTARALEVSDRWPAVFRHYHAQLCAKVRTAA